MERAAQAATPPLGVERAGGLQRARVDLDDRIQARALLVVGVDAREVQRDEALVRQGVGRDGGLDVRDARGQKVERSGLRAPAISSSDATNADMRVDTGQA